METWAPGNRGVEKMTLWGNHFLNIVYDGFNGLSNLFSLSSFLKIKMRCAFYWRMLCGTTARQMLIEIKGKDVKKVTMRTVYLFFVWKKTEI